MRFARGAGGNGFAEEKKKKKGEPGRRSRELIKTDLNKSQRRRREGEREGEEEMFSQALSNKHR